MRLYTPLAGGHWRSSGVLPESLAVDHPARLFVCARCRAQVLLCSRCDRGQRYCSRACSGTARREAQRAAAQRYQRSRAGRMAHADRSRRWRQRQCELAATVAIAAISPIAIDAAVDPGGQAHFVTHQGWLSVPPAAPLTVNEPDNTVSVTAADVPLVGARCRRCAAPLSPWVRQGFVRHGLRRWPARVVDPSP
ncbi:MAG: hypothetical protein C0443_13005 [Comamonadaceae bacterium]|nr:hypothetical protein [Comamonadaceae bacterium]